jgi:hypothetical protein
MMMGHRETLKGGCEYDAFTDWRKVLHWQPGELRKIKRGFNQRVRRKERRRLQQYKSENR